MKIINRQLIITAMSLSLLASCSDDKGESIKSVSAKNPVQVDKKVIVKVDLHIINGDVYSGDSSKSEQLDIAICGQTICGLYPRGQQVNAEKVIDVKGKIVSPGFIDPHTHSLAELLSKDKNHNLNYLTQGVTTVVNGNDGGGPVKH